MFLNDHCVEMKYKKKDEYIKDNFNTNTYIAAFTTSSARIRLHKMLDELKNKVMYYDTDSIVYIDGGTNEVKAGCMLCDWTDELGEDKYMKFWLSGASKDYGYILNNGSIQGKVNSFKMFYETETMLNFKNRMKVITGQTDFLGVEINQFQIQKDRQSKRIILNDYNTVPFGYHLD